MKKRICSFAAILLLLAAMLALPAQAASENQAGDARNGVVRILATRKNGTAWFGSAFAVGEAGKPSSVFVTNHHVTAGSDFAGADELYILLDDDWNAAEAEGGLEIDMEHAVRCHVLYEPEKYPDYAIIQAERVITERVALPLMPASLADPGESVYVIGFPGLSDDITQSHTAAVSSVTITAGIISRITHINMQDIDTDVIQTDAVINSGNSGGPMVTEEGYVIGLNTFSLVNESQALDGAIHMAVQSDYVISRLNDLIDIGTLSGFSYTLITDRESASILPTVLICAAVVAAAAVVAVVILRSSASAAKRKAAQAQPAQRRQPIQQPQPAPFPKTGPAEDTFPKTTGDDTIGKTVAADALPQLRLVGLEGYFAGRRFALESALRLGRLPDQNDLVFPANTTGVSGAHCVVRLTSAGATLTDLGSSFGTFLEDGTRLTPRQAVELKVGDCFTLGSQKQKFRLEAKAD